MKKILTLFLFSILAVTASAQKLNSEKEIIIKLSQDFNSQKFINYYNSSPKKWKKSVSIPIFANLIF
jgi:hypothetical protein